MKTVQVYMGEGWGNPLLLSSRKWQPRRWVYKFSVELVVDAYLVTTQRSSGVFSPYHQSDVLFLPFVPHPSVPYYDKRARLYQDISAQRPMSGRGVKLWRTHGVEIIRYVTDVVLADSFFRFQ